MMSNQVVSFLSLFYWSSLQDLAQLITCSFLKHYGFHHVHLGFLLFSLSIPSQTKSSLLVLHLILCIKYLGAWAQSWPQGEHLAPQQMIHGVKCHLYTGDSQSVFSALNFLLHSRLLYLYQIPMSSLKIIKAGLLTSQPKSSPPLIFLSQKMTPQITQLLRPQT